jgi:hypothetical protein
MLLKKNVLKKIQTLPDIFSIDLLLDKLLISEDKTITKKELKIINTIKILPKRSVREIEEKIKKLGKVI